MSELIGLFNLLAPFFGLIGLGFFCGRVVRQHEAGLAWMQFFLIYVALPCLFFRLIADKPLDQLANWRFIAVTTLSTFIAFALAFGSGWRHSRDLPQSVMQGVAGSYSNVGYMGPPLVLGALGAAASAPVVLIFVFDNLLLFSLVPLLMSVAGLERLSFRRDFQKDRLADPDPSVQRRDGFRASPQAISTCACRLPSTRWSLGSRGPPRPARSSSSVSPWRCGPCGAFRRAYPTLAVIKLIVHPLAGLGAAVRGRGFRSRLDLRGHHHGGAAAGSEHLCHRHPVQYRASNAPPPAS